MPKQERDGDNYDIKRFWFCFYSQGFSSCIPRRSSGFQGSQYWSFRADCNVHVYTDLCFIALPWAGAVSRAQSLAQLVPRGAKHKHLLPPSLVFPSTVPSQPVQGNCCHRAESDVVGGSSAAQQLGKHNGGFGTNHGLASAPTRAGARPPMFLASVGAGPRSKNTLLLTKGLLSTYLNLQHSWTVWGD